MQSWLRGLCAVLIVLAVAARSGNAQNGHETPSANAASSTGSSTQPQSLFDSLGDRVDPISITVEVHDSPTEIDTSGPQPLQAGAQEILTTAGSYGDLSRFMQILPGVVASSDLSNQMLVRGGHPVENLFLVDGIEVPNINHLAEANSTGGFGPMIDSAAIQGLKLSTGGFDARYPERLSSVTEIRSLETNVQDNHLEGDLGVQGAGGLLVKHAFGGSLLASAHHGLLNLISDDAGLNGVPSYTNELVRFRRTAPGGDQLTLLHVAGGDSISIAPCAEDYYETSSIDSQYSGWRETTGLIWQHIHSARSFSVLNLSDSEQVESIRQQDQITDPLQITFVPGIGCANAAAAISPLPVYSEDSNNAFTTAGYSMEWGSSRIGVTGGTAFWLERPHFHVAQPSGAPSPYLATPVRADSTSFFSDFSTGQSGSFLQAHVRPLKNLSLGAGTRFQTFAFGDHTTLTPRASVRYELGESLSFHAAYGMYAQLPPYINLLAYPGNRAMRPMRTEHEIAGADFSFLRGSLIRVEAYNKNYLDVPASTEYPSVTMHTMVDMIGEQLVWLPMNSTGVGKAAGIELSDQSHISSRFQVQGSVAYSRAKFAGTDQILRPSNFDFPWIANVAGIAQLKRQYTISGRYGYATGRPYTAFDLAESSAQNRPVYDLSKENTQRAPYYSRLDAQLTKEFEIHSLHLELYGGVDNILNRSNFLSYAWMPRYQFNKEVHGEPLATLWQMPIFPNFGIRLIAR